MQNDKNREIYKCFLYNGDKGRVGRRAEPAVEQRMESKIVEEQSKTGIEVVDQVLVK